MSVDDKSSQKRKKVSKTLEKRGTGELQLQEVCKLEAQQKITEFISNNIEELFTEWNKAQSKSRWLFNKARAISVLLNFTSLSGGLALELTEVVLTQALIEYSRKINIIPSPDEIF